MGRLLDREDFIDTFGLNVNRTRSPVRKPKWAEETGDYTAAELGILREFENLIKGSTLDDDSDFKKKLKELAEARLKDQEPKIDD